MLPAVSGEVGLRRSHQILGSRNFPGKQREKGNDLTLRMPQFQTLKVWFIKLRQQGSPCAPGNLNLRFVHSSSRGQCNLAVDFGIKQIWAHHFKWSKVKVLVAQLCLTLCDPMDCSPPGSSVHGILQARILEWVAISFSRGSSQPRD